MIDQENSKITRLENAREAETASRKGELNELQSRTALISSQIEQLIEQKKLQAKNIEDEATIPGTPTEPTQVGVPIYLVRYVQEDKPRYHILRP